MSKIIDSASKDQFCYWDSEKNAPIKEAAKLAYRLARIKAKIKWSPDHVDPEDIDPQKFAPGGDYYNSPETVRHYESAKQYSKIGHLDLLMGASVTCKWEKECAHQPIDARLNAYKNAKWLKEVFGV